MKVKVTLFTAGTIHHEIVQAVDVVIGTVPQSSTQPLFDVNIIKKYYISVIFNQLEIPN